MTIPLSHRSRVAEDMSDNSTLGSATIIRPISFELEITRNMEGAFKENDLPEVKIEGTLHKIEGFMSKGDYNTLIALVTTNFQEASTQHYSILAELIENYFRLAPWKRP